MRWALAILALAAAVIVTACDGDSRMPTEISPGSAIAGAPMPFGATITEADRQLVRDWVVRGAPRD